MTAMADVEIVEQPRRSMGWVELLTGSKRVATWTICLGVSLHALNWFVVGTITPSAVLELGRADLLSWVTAFYLVFSIVGSSGTPYLKNRFGLRALVIVSGLVVILGCVVVAAAPNMETLLVGRIIQGLAEGIIIALCYMMAAELIGEEHLPQLFGLLALVWAVATILGPIIGGGLAQLWSWRVAAASLILLSLLFLVLALTLLPKKAKDDSRPANWPLIRLTCLGGGSLALCAASEAQWQTALALTAGALFFLWLGFYLDRRAPASLFPHGLLSGRTPTCRGLWIIGLMPLAELGALLFVPYVVQVHFGMQPLIAGQVASVTALAWSFFAVVVARAPEAVASRLIVLGPVSLLLGLIALAVTVELHSLAGVIGALFAIGAGFGVSNGFICQRTISLSGEAERDVASGAIPTLEGLGAALGAAIAGIAASLNGFPSEEAGTRPISIAIFIGGLLAIPAVIVAVKFARTTKSASP